MSYQSDIFAKNLRKRRRELGLTQRALAELIGYTEKSVSKWESGFATAPSAILPLLAKSLNTSIDSLFSERAQKRYYLGIDGGGTKTDFALADSEGNIISRAVLGGSNPVDIGIERTLDILSEGIAAVCSEISNSEISVFAGLSGGTTGNFKTRIKSFLERYDFLSANNGSDAENATALALGEGEGTAIIIGTGSIALTRRHGTLIRNGGYGVLFDDGGSGFAIGRDAVIAALQAEECRGNETILLTALKKKFEVSQLKDALGTLYEGGKRMTASLSLEVFEALRCGDVVAEEIIDRNMHAIARLMENASKDKTEVHRVVLVGSIAKDFDIICPYIKRHLEYPEKYELTANTMPPIYGALMLAGASIGKE